MSETDAKTPTLGLLSYLEIRELIEQKVITEVDLNCINGTSLDIRLGHTFLFEEPPLEGSNEIIDFRNRDQPPYKLVKLEDSDESIILKPGQCVLAHSIERFYLPDNLSAQYSCKSSMGRLFLNHMLAGWCDPGWNDSVLTLELANHSLRPIRLRPTDAIGQMKFFRHTPVPHDKSYEVRGRYNHDATVKGIKK